VGQYASVSYKVKQCDGSSATAAACKQLPDNGCLNHLTCGSATTCKGMCATDADCVQGSWCNPGTHLCSNQATGGGCGSGIECKSRICLSGACQASGANSIANYTENCNDGQPFACPSAAPNCGATDGQCHCGTGAGCPDWMVCISGTCKIAGGRTCLATSDCAYGPCTSNVCPPTPQGDYCTSDTDSGQECDANLTCEVNFDGFGFKCF
jgi:hypothetical protein